MCRTMPRTATTMQEHENEKETKREREKWGQASTGSQEMGYWTRQNI